MLQEKTPPHTPEHQAKADAIAQMGPGRAAGKSNGETRSESSECGLALEMDILGRPWAVTLGSRRSGRIFIFFNLGRYRFESLLSTGLVRFAGPAAALFVFW